MDAIEFIKESNRMCEAFNDNCKSKDGNNFYCGLRHESNKNGESCDEYIRNHPDKAVAIVEKWAKEHPRKTRQEKFLEMFPKTNVDANNVITICPHETCIGYKCDLKWGESTESKCRECRKKYWLETEEE